MVYRNRANPYSGSGPAGPPGTAATVAVGTTTTGAAGSSASVTNSGSSSAAILNFTVPRGDAGAPGSPGTNGTNGTNGLTPALRGTSSTSFTPGTGSKVFALSPAMNVAFPIGAYIRARSTGANWWMDGYVTAASTTSVTVQVDTTSGGTAQTDWTLVLAGQIGQVGAQGPPGLTGATGPQGLTPDLRATSTSTVAIWSSTPTTWPLSPAMNVPFPVGSRIVASVVGGTRFSGGTVTASSTTSVTIAPDEVSGNGTSASDWVIVLAGYRGPAGAAGATGAKGDTGDTGPQGSTGLTGATGPANSLAIGTVTTGAAGSSASASVTGTPPSQTLNLTIPRGATGATGGTGATGPAGPTVVIGESGKQYRLISGVLRNSGSGWAWINDAGHVPTGVTPTVTADSTSIYINFGATASKVSSLQVTPDETLTSMGVRAGVSVGTSSATIQLFNQDPFTLNDFVQYASGAWSSFNGVYTGFSYSSGSLILTHEDMGTTYNFGASIANRGPVLAQVSALSATTTQVQFYTGSFGALTLATTANTNMRFYLTRHGRRAAVPQADPTTVVAANGNLWVTGFMEV